jgi:hypothetical protein
MTVAKAKMVALNSTIVSSIALRTPLFMGKRTGRLRMPARVPATEVVAG